MGETLGEVRARVSAETSTLERERREASRAKQALDALRTGKFGTSFSEWGAGTNTWGASSCNAVQQPANDPWCDPCGVSSSTAWGASTSNTVQKPRVSTPEGACASAGNGQAASPWYAGLSLVASPGV